jgi:hypothetical protein
MSWTPRILTEFEIGQAVTAIETVARLGKPLAEIGCRQGNPADIEHDLTHCLRSANELGKLHVWTWKAGERYRFGFCAQPWVLRALEFVEDSDLAQSDRDWLCGLLFGYKADAIQQYLDRASEAGGGADDPKANHHSIHTQNNGRCATALRS